MTHDGNVIPFGGVSPRIHRSAFVAPTATIIGNVEVGPEASIWFGAVIRGDDPDYPITIGARANIQDNAVIHVSAQGATVVEDEVTVGHGACLESCVVGKGSVVGMGAVILQEATLGPGCMVAAGAVVKGAADVPARS